MQDNIPDALIAAFERQYDADWNDPALRNERLAMRYGWNAAMEHKHRPQSLQHFASTQDMTTSQPKQAAPTSLPRTPCQTHI